MDGVTVVDHPMVQHKLTLMRDKERSTKGFRQLLNEIGRLLVLRGDARPAVGAGPDRDAPDGDDGPQVAGKKLVFAPILEPAKGFSRGCSTSCRRRGSRISASTAIPRP